MNFFLPNLQHTNKLTGKIPPQVESMALLRQLWLNNNLITGEIPSQLGSLRDLSTLHLENTKITGQVPAELGNLKVLGESFILYRTSMHALAGHAHFFICYRTNPEFCHLIKPSYPEHIQQLCVSSTPL